MTNQPLDPNASVSIPAEGTPAQPKGRRGGKKAGRPSLSGGEKGGNTSPQIAFRVNPTLRQKAQEVAESEGVNVSQLGRKALKEYLANK
jgi:hypothetical protein